eukprot:633284-Amphidinium_carterae.1
MRQQQQQQTSTTTAANQRPSAPSTKQQQQQRDWSFSCLFVGGFKRFFFCKLIPPSTKHNLLQSAPPKRSMASGVEFKVYGTLKGSNDVASIIVLF